MNIAIPFRPKLFEAVKLYSGEQFRRGFGAEINVMVMAFPLSVAFAIASSDSSVFLVQAPVSGTSGTRGLSPGAEMNRLGGNGKHKT